MRDLYYGGWTAENIYFLGAANIIDIIELTAGGTVKQTLSLGGISGIEGHYDFKKGLYEKFPYYQNEIKSIYHYRQYEIQKFELFS